MREKNIKRVFLCCLTALADINQEFHGQLWKVSSWDKAQFWNYNRAPAKPRF